MATQPIIVDGRLLLHTACGSELLACHDYSRTLYFTGSSIGAHSERVELGGSCPICGVPVTLDSLEAYTDYIRRRCVNAEASK